MRTCLLAIALGAVALAQMPSNHPPLPKLKKPPELIKVDLNTATKEQLLTLPGIDEALARKIMAGRPYVSKSKLLTRKVLSPAQYELLRKLIFVKNPPMPR